MDITAVNEKCKKAKQKVCNAMKKAGDWMLDHPVITAIGISTVVSVIGGSIAYKNIEITAGDVVEYSDASGGWIVLDPNTDVWWPVTHGLSDEELGRIKLFMDENDVCFGEALNQMKFLRFG